MYKHFIKRLLDLLLALLGLLLLCWLFLLLAVAVKLDSPGSAIFAQQRVGRDGRTFMLYKFRTMRSDTPRDVPTHLLEGPQRYITKTGRWLRRTSLDELPQLVNILLGQMSFVGPRPALPNQTDLLLLRSANGADKLAPGLSGWAQINGRDELPVEQKARLDGEYAQNISFTMDCRCFFCTIKYVFKGNGIVEGKKE